MLGLLALLAGHVQATPFLDIAGQCQVALCDTDCTLRSLAAHAAACSQSKPAELHEMGGRHCEAQTHAVASYYRHCMHKKR